MTDLKQYTDEKVVKEAIQVATLALKIAEMYEYETIKEERG